MCVTPSSKIFRVPRVSNVMLFDEIRALKQILQAEQFFPQADVKANVKAILNL